MPAKIKIGRIWEVMPISKTLYEAMQEAGYPDNVAAAMLWKSAIVLAGKNPRYNSARKTLGEEGFSNE